MAIPQRWLKPKNKPRSCDKCGKPYLRRNLTEGWPIRNPGHRAGWIKQKIKICMNCSTPESTQRMLMVASVVKGKF
jgi:hypothetical protein